MILNILYLSIIFNSNLKALTCSISIYMIFNIQKNQSLYNVDVKLLTISFKLSMYKNFRGNLSVKMKMVFIFLGYLNAFSSLY